MKQSIWLKTRYLAALALLSTALFATIFTGCATNKFERRNATAVSAYFDKDKNTVWDAAIKSLDEIPIEVQDFEKGILRTHWVKGWSRTRTTGLLLDGQWQERYRLLVYVTCERNKTCVSVNTQTEAKAPGGSQAYRWTRVVSDGDIEREFLKRLEGVLGGS